MQKENLLKNAMKVLSEPSDSCQIFGDYVADQMRSMIEKKRKKLKLIIQKAIIELEEQDELEELEEKEDEMNETYLFSDNDII